MLSNIPKMRILLYALLAGLLPIIFALANFISNQGRITALETTLQDMQQLSLIREKKQSINMAVSNHFRDADHFYIDKYLETLTFLEPEIESLQRLLSDKNFADDETMRKRLEFLTSPSNSLAFSEGIVQPTSFSQEVTETLVHPVEINGLDLQKLLSRIEGLNIGSYNPGENRPQLLILDFKLDRKNVNEKNEIFTLNLKLLKREYL